MTVQDIGDEFTVLSHHGKAQAKVMFVSGCEVKEVAGVEMIGDDVALIKSEKVPKKETAAEDRNINYKEKLVQAVADFVEEKDPDYKKDVIKHQTLRTLLIEFTCKWEEDLKANFDYVLEGKDLEIKELKDADEYIIKTLESKVEKLQEDLRNKRISIKNKKSEIVLLGERCNQLLKDKGDLTDVVRALEVVREDFIKDNARLEKENAEQQLKIVKLQDYLDRDRDEKDKKIKNLEKENAELKHNKKTVVHLAECLEEKQKERLAQAIKIIKGLLPCCRNYPQENAEKIEQAEQFIKE